MLRQRLRKPTRTARARWRHYPRLDVLEGRVVPATVAFFLLDDPEFPSSLTLSGTVGGAPIEPQGEGSLTTQYFGQIYTDINAAGRTLQFQRENTEVFATDSGEWQPLRDGSAGAEPANYGGRVDFLGLALAAVRDLVVTTFTSASLTLTELDTGIYTFPSTQTLGIVQGVAAYNHPLLGGGSLSLADQSAPNQASEGILIDFGPFGFEGFWFMHFPVQVTLRYSLGGFIDVTLNITGAMNAFGIRLEEGPGGGPTPGEDLAPALAYLDTFQTEVSSFPPTTLRAGDEGSPLVPSGQAPDDARVSQEIVAAPAGEPVRLESAVDRVFADPFRDDWAAREW